MKKRYFSKYTCGLKKHLFFILLLSSSIIAQKNSEAYLSIKNSEGISNTKKELKIDSLFHVFEYQEKFIPLANDLYDYAKWQYRNGTIEKAIAASKKCILAIERVPSFDEIIHKRAVNNLGFFYGKIGDYYNAFRAFNKLSSLGTTDSYTADAFRLAGRNLRYLGDFYRAADAYERSIEVARKIDEPKIFVINSIDASINYKDLGTAASLNRGVEILYQAIELTNKVNAGGPKHDKIPLEDVFSLYNYLGSLFNDREDYDFAKSQLNYHKSLRIATQLKDSALLSIVNNDLGYLYFQDKREEAINYLNKALLYKPDTRLTSKIYANRNYHFLRLRNKKEALANIQRSINILTPISLDDSKGLPTRDEVAKCSYKIELLESLIDRSETLLAFYNPTDNSEEELVNALETLSLADFLVDLIRFESNEQQSKLFWRKTASEIYTSAVKACFHLNKPEEAFYFMEKNKAILLLEDLSIRQQRERGQLPDSIHERQLELRASITKYNTLLNDSQEQKDSVRSLLLAAKDVHANFINSLEGKYDFYYNTHKPAKVLSLREAQDGLKLNKHVYVEYSLGAKEGFGMFITRDTSQLFRIEDYQTLLTRSQVLRRYLEVPLKTKVELLTYHKLANSLFKSLFPKPIASSLGHQKLVIIPDLYLQNIPFEALTISEDPGSYLIKENNINYAYSVSFLTQNKAYRRKNNKTLVGFAPVNFKEGFPSLPYSKQELENLTNLFSAKVFMNTTATKKNFKANIKDFDIIHIASHADVVDNQPWILFEDEKLSLEELYLTENTANLVVLSACKTSLGSLEAGEGVMSLARGFFNTGTNSVLSTLWNVNDASSSSLITEFYKNIKKGKTKSEALHLAKLDYINQHELSQQSPYYWSSFVLIGAAGEKPISHNETLLLILFLSLLLSIVSYLFYRKKKDAIVG